MTHKFTLRIPEELRDDLVAVAKEDQRKLNGEILFILKSYVRRRKRHDLKQRLSQIERTPGRNE